MKPPKQSLDREKYPHSQKIQIPSIIPFGLCLQPLGRLSAHRRPEHLQSLQATRTVPAEQPSRHGLGLLRCGEWASTPACVVLPGAPTARLCAPVSSHRCGGTVPSKAQRPAGQQIGRIHLALHLARCPCGLHWTGPSCKSSDLAGIRPCSTGLFFLCLPPGHPQLLLFCPPVSREPHCGLQPPLVCRGPSLSLFCKLRAQLSLNSSLWAPGGNANPKTIRDLLPELPSLRGFAPLRESQNRSSHCQSRTPGAGFGPSFFLRTCHPVGPQVLPQPCPSSPGGRPPTELLPPRRPPEDRVWTRTLVPSLLCSSPPAAPT